MKKLFLSILILATPPLSMASDLLSEVTPYGYSAKNIIIRYEDTSNNLQIRTSAIIDFTHVFYANAMAIAMIRKYQKDENISYYCDKNSPTNPAKEIDLFVSWVKLQAQKDATILNDAITTLYPAYLATTYPISKCQDSG